MFFFRCCCFFFSGGPVIVEACPFFESWNLPLCIRCLNSVLAGAFIFGLLFWAEE